MHGRQYYYGLSVGAAYKFSDNFSAFAGVRGVYASTNYYGYVENIKVGNMPLYKVLDPNKENAANIELSCDQSGIGFTPIIGVDFKTCSTQRIRHGNHRSIRWLHQKSP